MKTTKRLTVLLTILVLLTISAIVVLAGPQDLPMPYKIKIVSSGTNLPKKLSALSGRWYGAWDNILDHVLVVEEITATDAVVIYSHGTAPQWNISRASWGRHRVDVVRETIVIQAPEYGATITYWTEGEVLLGTYVTRRGTSNIRMQRY